MPASRPSPPPTVPDPYRLAAEAAEVGIWACDFAADRVEASARYRALLGLPAEGPIRCADVIARIHPDDRAVVDHRLRDALAHGGPVRLDYRIVDPDGRVRWLSTRGQALPDGAGGAGRVYGVVGDVTSRIEPQLEREELLRALEAERAKLAHVFALAPAFLAVLRGPAHVVELANPACERLVGHRPLLGLAVRQAFPEIEGQGFFELLDRVYESGEPFVGTEVPVRLRHESDGPPETRYIDFVYQPVREPDGTISGILAHGVDVTAQVRARREVEELAERYRLVNRATSDVIWDWDLTTDALYWNEAAAARIGTAPASPGPTIDAWIERIHPDDRDQVLRGIRAAIAGDGESWADEYRFRAEHGGFATFLDRGFIARDAEGRAVRMIGARQDVTREREAAKRLQQAERMEAVGTLAGGVAHEVNNMMTAVVGFGEFVLRSMAPDRPERRDVAEMVKAGRRAADVTRQLLAFSRQQVLRPTVIDLGAVVRELAPALERTLGSDKRLMLAAAEVAPVLADRTQLEQVLVNLIANARDALPAGGTVTVALAVVERRTDGGEREPTVRLTVQDTGHGMDAATRARIFEPFFTTKPVGQGTGLGLSMVLGVVQQTGGEIDVASTPGEGTIFTITLPRAEARPEPAPAAGATPAGGHETVLVVEDEPLVRELIRRALTDQGYTVRVAAQGAAGLAELGRMAECGERPDLIVTDVVMPQLNGGSLAAAAERRCPGLPVLFISGYAGDEVIERGLLPPGRPCLQKLFSPDGLVAEVRRVLDAAAR